MAAVDRQECLNHIGDLVHFFTKQCIDPNASPEKRICGQVMKDCMEDAYIRLERMFNLDDKHGIPGVVELEPLTQVIEITRPMLQRITNKMMLADMDSVVLADDGRSFLAIGRNHKTDQGRQLFHSESLQ